MNELLDIIKQGNVGVFFGAGISFNANIPTVHHIVGKIMDSLEMNEHKEKILGLKFPFEVFMEILSQYTSIDALLDVFSLGEPTSVHYVLKYLVENGYVKNLMSTNFDLLVEKAGINGLDNILTDENKFSQYDFSKVNYIKIHGCVSDKKSIRATMNVIMKRRLKNQRRKAIEYFFKEAGLSAIFVMGYSCSDKMDITPFVKSINDSKTQIVFIQHGKEHDGDNMEAHDLFSNFQRRIFKCNTDDFISLLCNEFNVAKTKQRQNMELNKYFDFSSLNINERKLFVSKIYFKNSKFDDALYLLESSIRQIKQTNADKLVESDIYSFLFELYSNKIEDNKNYKIHYNQTVNYEKFEELNSYFLFSAEAYKSISDKKESNDKSGELYIHWGHLLLSLQKHDDALIAYETAKKYFQLTKNYFRLNQVKNNIGNVYFMRYKDGYPNAAYSAESTFRETMKLWLSCRDYYNKSEYLSENAIIYSNIGELLVELKPNHKKRAEKYLLRAKDLYIYLNDKYGINECDNYLKKIQGNGIRRHSACLER